MIITKIEELRLHSPAHALDSIDTMIGFIDNSEHDFLQPYLGATLYSLLATWYDTNVDTYYNKYEECESYYNRLLLLAQRVVAFDALGRSIGMQQVSVNNAGVNAMVTDDYQRPSKDDIEQYRVTCQRESHSAVNRLLTTLEEWSNSLTTSTTDTELTAIIAAWKLSRYYYLAAQMLIPSASIMQEYINIYDSREKFIQLLPDLQFVQEEIISPAIGDALLSVIVAYATDGTLPAGADATVYKQSLHRLRKVVASLTVERTQVFKFTKDQRQQAHDSSVRLMDNALSYLTSVITSFPQSAYESSPLYTTDDTVDTTATDTKRTSPVQSVDVFQDGDSAAWAPPMF